MTSSSLHTNVSHQAAATWLVCHRLEKTLCKVFILQHKRFKSLPADAWLGIDNISAQCRFTTVPEPEACRPRFHEVALAVWENFVQRKLLPWDRKLLPWDSSNSCSC